MKQALLVVDVQKDFLPGGALAVPEGDQVVNPANELIRKFEEKSFPIFITRDWHPANHCSFKEQGGTWPPHCVMDTPGAEFDENLIIPPSAVILSKATQPDREAYSDFDGSRLADRLNNEGIDQLVVVGIATDYCVRASVLDGIAAGFRVVVVPEGIRAVNVNPDDGAKAVEEMRHCGARFIPLESALKQV